MRNQQPGCRVGAFGAQGSIEFGQTVQEEGHTAILARQRIQDAAVEHEKAMHLAALLQGRGQGGVVVQAQVTSQPDQAGIELVRHGGS